MAATATVTQAESTLREVSTASLKIFASAMVQGQRVMQSFYDGFLAALKDVCPDWKHLTPEAHKTAFSRVREAAKSVMVDRSHGGNATNGLSLSRFNGYVCAIKKAVSYNAPITIAECATEQELQDARRYVNEHMQGDRGTPQSKIARAYKLQEEERIRVRAHTRKKAMTQTVSPPPVGAPPEGPPARPAATVLPDPVDYDNGDSDSDALLNTSIRNFLLWLRSDALKPHLAKKKLASAKVLKEVGMILTAHEDRQQAKATRKNAVA